jgi:hypothetical protein
MPSTTRTNHVFDVMLDAREGGLKFYVTLRVVAPTAADAERLARDEAERHGFVVARVEESEVRHRRSVRATGILKVFGRSYYED